MIGFDVDLMKAVATTLKLKVNENNVTFDSIIAGVTSGRFQVGNSSFTDNKAREKSVNFVDYFTAGEGVYAKASSKLKFKGFKSFCGWKVAVEKSTVEQTDAQAAALEVEEVDDHHVPESDRGQLGSFVRPGRRRLRGQPGRRLHRVNVEGKVQASGQRGQRGAIRHRHREDDGR